MKRKFLTLTLSLAVNAYASGIPVIDSAAIAQSAQQSIQQLAEMAKQLTEAQKQVEQLKASVKAMTGVKGFSDILEGGGVDPQIISTFDDLLKGNTQNLTESAKKYFDNLPNCKDAKNPAICEQAALAGVAQVNFVEELDKQMGKELKDIETLSHRIKQTQDMKSIAELQADIALKSNRIAVLQQKSADYERKLKSTQAIDSQQKQEQFHSSRWKNVSEDLKLFDRTKINRNNSYDNLMK